MTLPDSIRALVGHRPYQQDHVGMSDAQIRIYDEWVLKVEPLTSPMADTVRMLRFLDGKLPVPQVIHYERDDQAQYLLMTRIPGEMACAPASLEYPDVLFPALAETIRLLWHVDVTGIPNQRTLHRDLDEARYRVEHGLVDMEHVQPATYGPDGFRNPAELLAWLETHQPPVDPVFCHGDLCLPNIMMADGRLSGLIDLGSACVGDRWRDLAILYRSLKNNASGKYGGPAYPDIHPEALFKHLGLSTDWEKIRYYILLDELF